MSEKKTGFFFGGRVSFKDKLLYMCGNAGDSLPYALFYTYFMFYLTDVAGINSIIAGFIAGIAAFCDGAVDPALGIFSDKNYRRYGTRRPIMAKSLLPLCLVTIFMFLPIDFGPFGLIYYILISCCFVAMYSLFTMNYVSMGGEMTDSPIERNNIRLICSLSSPIWNYIGRGGPQLVQDAFPQLSARMQWFLIGLLVTCIYGLFSIVPIFVAKSKKQVEEMRRNGDVGLIPEPEEEDEDNGLGFMANLKSAMSLKPLRINCLMIVMYTLSEGFLYALIAYVLDYSVGLTAAQQATFYLVGSIFNYVGLLGGTWLANHFGKKIVFCGSFSLAAILCFVYLFIGMHTLVEACIFYALWMCVETPFWALYCTNSFEIADLDEFINGKRRTALVQSVGSFFVKVGPTCSLIFTGVLLKAIGYIEGGAVQPESVATGLNTLVCVIPAVCLGIGAIAFFRYPINNKNQAALVEALEAKKAGRSYSTEGFANLLPRNFKG